MDSEGARAGRGVAYLGIWPTAVLVLELNRSYGSRGSGHRPRPRPMCRSTQREKDGVGVQVCGKCWDQAF